MGINKILLSVSLIFTLACPAVAAPITPQVMPKMPQAAQGAPGQQQPAMPGVNPAVPAPPPVAAPSPAATPTNEPAGFEQIFRLFLEHAGPGVPTPPTPQQLEQRYHRVWQMIGDTYHVPSALNDWSRWEHKYDGKLQTQDDLDKALKEMAGSLNDRWTQYVSGKDIVSSRSNSQAGIVRSGAMLKQLPDGTVAVDFMLWGSPAQKSDLRKGDIIKSVAGTDLKGLSPNDADKLMTGKTGSKLSIVFHHDGKDDNLDLTLAPTPDPAVEARLLPGNIGYVRLPDFSNDRTIAEFLDAIAELSNQTEGNLEGLVVDLRGNPGGQFQLAIMLSSMFLEKGTIVTGSTRSGRMVQHNTWEVIPVLPHMLKNAPDDIMALTLLMQKLPLAVIIDGSSASASEVVTGALKDNGRATIIGVTSYGKGVGYNRYPMSGGGQLTITTLDYLTPSGYNLSNRGIAPTVEVEQPRGSSVDEQLNAAVRALRGQLLTPAKKPTSSLPGTTQVGISQEALMVCLLGAFLIALIAFAVARKRSN